ncbi:MAG: TIGR03013 family XrtA/PEP-CTERM system glycosyltransferase [Burkholderiales bacterium]
MVNFFRHHVPAATLLQLLIEGGLFVCAVFVAVKLHRHSATLTEPAVLAPAAIFAGLMVCVNGALGLYRRDQKLDFVNFVARSIVALFVGFVVSYVAFGAFPYGRIFQDALWFTVLYALVGLVIAHEVLLVPLTRAAFPHRILVVGTGPEARAVEQCLVEANQPNLKLMGFYSLEQNAPRAVAANRIVSGRWPIDELTWKLGVDEIVVAVREQRGGVLPLEQLLSCRVSGVRVTDLAGFVERIRGEVPVESLKASWLIYGDGFCQSGSRNLIKRTVDLLAALCLLALTAPIMVLAAVAIVLESGFPFIYRQERVGARGQKFMLLKFRSMVSDAEPDGEARWATVNDARVTRVGRILRRMRIDELPQLVNVLKGEMSFVGPRPERPCFVEQLTEKVPFYGVRHSVKPGITGWAQVRCPYGASIEDAARKLQFDLFYVKNHTFFLDILILAATVRVVLFAEGSR